MKLGDLYSKLVKSMKLTTIVVGICSFATVCLVIPTGANNNNANFEYSASYLSDIAKNGTKNGDFAAFIVETKDEKYKMANSNSEYYFLQKSFGTELPNFAGTVNADKKQKINIPEVDNYTNFSFLYIESAGFTEVDTGKGYYRQEVYPLDVMFAGDHKDGSYSLCYISQSQADKVLASRGKTPSPENYLSLVGTETNINFKGVSYNFKIGNVYYERGTYYEALNSIMGEFLLGYNRYPKGFNKQATYLLTKYDFQTQYYLEHASKQYSPEYYSYSISSYNLKQGVKVDSNKAFKFFSGTSRVASIIFTILAFAIFFVTFWFILDTNFSKKIYNLGVLVGSLGIPYGLFALIAKLTSDYFLLSTSSSILIMILSILLIFEFLILYFKDLSLRKEAKDEH